MRRLWMAGLAGIAGLLLTTQAGAVIIGTAHETTAGSGGGACGACHIPHAGGANRLWPAAAGTGTYIGVVAPLCSSCHASTGGYLAVMSAAFSDAYVYGAASHGSLMANNATTDPTSTAAETSGLEYANSATVWECTTCHNVHDDQTARPFLRDNLNVICARCHTNRHYVNGTLDEGAAPVVAGAWGGLARTGRLNPGSHPVGTDVTGELDTTNRDSVVFIPAQMSVTYDNDVTNGGAGQWSLGGKRMGPLGTEGITCVTCHAVHGIQKDGDDGGNTGLVAKVPVTNYLAIEQASTASITGYGRSVANGIGTGSVLCEGCHGRSAATTLNSPTGYTGSYAVNPGAASTFTHPVDDWDSQYTDAGVSAFPANWPTGASGTFTVANMNPIAICESCHQPHPVAELASTRADVKTGAAAYILRDTVKLICSDCHTNSFAGHHPVSQGGDTYSSATVGYLSNVTNAAGDVLRCSTCHTDSGAHNWTARANVGLDAAWLPTNNNRTGTQATEMFSTNMSKTCMDCHYGMDGNRASVSPTMRGSNNMPTPQGGSTYSEVDYQYVAASMGTHYIGTIHTAATNWKGDGTTDARGTWTAPRVAILADNHNWSALPGGAAGYSRFGGTSGAPAIVCESCHELEPDRNIDGHLLLGTSAEGFNGTEGVSGDISGRDEFCEACHGVPVGTHQLTGYVVSRTAAALQASDASVPWLRGASGNLVPIGNATVNAAANELSCDSCHQVHDANTNSYTFMLDAPATLTIGTTNNVVLVGPGTEDLTTSVHANYAIAGATEGYATPTLVGRGGEYSGYCDQCHAYAYQ